MGYIGLPRHLAEWISSLGLSQFWLLMALMVFFIILGCFLDGISMVVLTMGVILPTVQKPASISSGSASSSSWSWRWRRSRRRGLQPVRAPGMTKKQITWIARQTLPMFYLMTVAILLTYFFPGWSRGCRSR